MKPIYSSVDSSPSLRFALTLLLFPFSIQSTLIIGAILGFTPNWYLLSVSVLLFAICCWRVLPAKNLFANLTGIILVIVGAFIFALFFQDFAYDTRAYHLPASIMISEGWNPIYETIPPEFPMIQIVNFPKGQWMINSGAIFAFQSIEAGKFTHPIYMLVTILVSWIVLKQLLPHSLILAFAIAVGISLNPVALSQMPLNSVDGALASQLTILAMSLYGLTFLPSKLLQAVSVFSAIILASIKTSGLAFMGVIWLLFLVFVWVYKREEFKRWLQLSFFVGFTITLLNTNPYVTNTIEKRNPVYPIFSDKTISARPWFEDFNRFERFYIAYSSSTNMINGNPDNPWEHWRNPFLIENLKNLRIANPSLARTYGAFGPWFGIGLLISLVCAFALGRSEILLVSMILLTAFLHDEGWHARYTPQIWLIPWIVLSGIVRKAKTDLYVPISVACLLIAGSTILLFRGYPNLYAKTEAYFKVRDSYENSEITFNDAFSKYYRMYGERAHHLFHWTEKKRLEHSGSLKTSDNAAVFTK